MFCGKYSVYKVEEHVTESTYLREAEACDL